MVSRGLQPLSLILSSCLISIFFTFLVSADEPTTPRQWYFIFDLTQYSQLTSPWADTQPPKESVLLNSVYPSITSRQAYLSNREEPALSAYCVVSMFNDAYSAAYRVNGTRNATSISNFPPPSTITDAPRITVGPKVPGPRVVDAACCGQCTVNFGDEVSLLLWPATAVVAAGNSSSNYTQPSSAGSGSNVNGSIPTTIVSDDFTFHSGNVYVAVSTAFVQDGCGGNSNESYRFAKYNPIDPASLQSLYMCHSLPDVTNTYSRSYNRFSQTNECDAHKVTAKETDMQTSKSLTTKMATWMSNGHQKSGWHTLTVTYQSNPCRPLLAFPKEMMNLVTTGCTGNALLDPPKTLTPAGGLLPNSVSVKATNKPPAPTTQAAVPWSLPPNTPPETKSPKPSPLPDTKPSTKQPLFPSRSKKTPATIKNTPAPAPNPPAPSPHGDSSPSPVSTLKASPAADAPVQAPHGDPTSVATPQAAPVQSPNVPSPKSNGGPIHLDPSSVHSTPGTTAQDPPANNQPANNKPANALEPVSNPATKGTPEPHVFTIASETFSLAPSGLTVAVGGHTLTANAPEITVGGQRVSLGSTQFIVGTRTEYFASPAKSPSAPTGGGQAPGVAPSAVQPGNTPQQEMPTTINGKATVISVPGVPGSPASGLPGTPAQTIPTSIGGKATIVTIPAGSGIPGSPPRIIPTTINGKPTVITISGIAGVPGSPAQTIDTTINGQPAIITIPAVPAALAHSIQTSIDGVPTLLTVPTADYIPPQTISTAINGVPILLTIPGGMPALTIPTTISGVATTLTIPSVPYSPGGKAHISAHLHAHTGPAAAQQTGTDIYANVLSNFLDGLGGVGGAVVPSSTAVQSGEGKHDTPEGEMKSSGVPLGSAVSAYKTGAGIGAASVDATGTGVIVPSGAAGLSGALGGVGSGLESGDAAATSKGVAANSGGAVVRAGGWIGISFSLGLLFVGTT